MKRHASMAAIAAALWSLAACGGGGGSSSETQGGPTPQAVTGVSTPSSVSVVTAKNAQ